MVAGTLVADALKLEGRGPETSNSRSGSLTGSGFSRTAETSDQAATAAPIPHASATTDAIVDPKSLRSRRNANRSSSNRSAFITSPTPEIGRSQFQTRAAIRAWPAIRLSAYRDAGLSVQRAKLISANA